MTETCPAAFVDLAGRMADAAGDIARRYFRLGIAADDKPDSSPVTAADREAEAAMRAMIEAEFPDHGIWGEEYGVVRGEAEYLWVLDPIDGTKAFMTGLAVFGTLIALARRDRPILGAIDQPISRERWLGAAGHGTTLNGAPVRTTAETDPKRVALYATHPDMFLHDGDPARFARLSAGVRFTRFGAECYGYGLLASGHAGLCVDATMKPHDYMALIPVVEGAGGVTSDWAGRPLGMASDGHVLAAASPALHAAALRLIGG
ncbi:MAG: inositol monophosphatase family protein [Alphaproteobacteria bacterium]